MTARLIASTLGLVITSWIATSPVAAADLPRQLTIGPDVLQLNGSGSRTKSFVSVYSAGLYLKQRTNRAEEIISANETMSIRIEVTSNFVNRDKLIAALQDGLKSATGGDLRPIQNEAQQFSRCFVGEVKLGDVFDLVYLPQSGVVVLKNGKRQGIIQGLEFKQALFGIWLSNQPADAAIEARLTWRLVRIETLQRTSKAHPASHRVSFAR